MASKTNFEWLQEWYSRHTDGDWEHQNGIKIETLDNPGWSVLIDLDGTELSDRDFQRRQVERSENDWFHLWTDHGEFEIACGPMNLEEALGVFREWAERST